MHSAPVHTTGPRAAALAVAAPNRFPLQVPPTVADCILAVLPATRPLPLLPTSLNGDLASLDGNLASGAAAAAVIAAAPPAFAVVDAASAGPASASQLLAAFAAPIVLPVFQSASCSCSLKR